ncbi:MAG: ABC transporter permease [Kiritimatiellae bacterium]|nr:ABC transporter permease [Kiritimatiellia bacterium]MDW8458152.1 ABC transporter permease [Verrucomicrobiota bacterium]
MQLNGKTLINMIPLAAKQVVRSRMRALLTAAGIAMGMFVFAAVETLRSAVARATTLGAEDTTLVVYRENRYCPAASRLPLHYEDEIRRVPGVREVIPIQIVVNNCGASLDVITFRGVPPRQLLRYAPEIRIVRGSLEDWMRADDGALIGEQFAKRRGLAPGDVFQAAGVRVRISGILSSPNPQDNSVAYVHLPFLQQASGRGLGEVTQFNVRVEDPSELLAVADAIDARFRSAPEPTKTTPEKAFFAQAASDLVELSDYSKWIGYGAVVAVLGLIGNAVLLAVRGRVREVAIVQTLGYSSGAVAWLVLLEGILLGLAGGAAGAGAAWIFFEAGRFTFGNEGQIISLTADPRLLADCLGIALGLGAAAAAAPAWIAARTPIVASLRS